MLAAPFEKCQELATATHFLPRGGPQRIAPHARSRCDCGALLRPDVVWFGEVLPEGAMQEATEAARRSEVFLSIGTSSLVYPAAALPEVAKRHGAYLVEINIETTPLSPLADELILGPAAGVLPDLLGA